MSTQHTTGEMRRYVEAWSIRRETDAMLRQSRPTRYETRAERYDREEAKRREREERARQLREAGREEWLNCCRIEAERNAGGRAGSGPFPKPAP
jgi:hypothetical protein